MFLDCYFFFIKAGDQQFAWALTSMAVFSASSSFQFCYLSFRLCDLVWAQLLSFYLPGSAQPPTQWGLIATAHPSLFHYHSFSRIIRLPMYVPSS